MSWKRCEDELPDADQTVLIYAAGADEPVWMGFYDSEVWRDAEGMRAEVTHWLPFPEPPNEKLTD